MDKQEAEKKIMDMAMIPAGTIVHIGGIPVSLVNDTAISSNKANLSIILKPAIPRLQGAL